MLKITMLICAAALGLASCGSDATSSADASGALDSTATNAAAVNDAFGLEPTAGANYGAGVANGVEVLPFEEFIAQVRQQDSITTVVQGEVVKVCQKKGCWMNLQPVAASPAEAATAEAMSVRFKDYGFFMPKTLAGSNVVVEGTARRRVVPVDELRHYAEDAGESPETIAAITEPEEELEFIATGVRVL